MTPLQSWALVFAAAFLAYGFMWALCRAAGNADKTFCRALHAYLREFRPATLQCPECNEDLLEVKRFR